MWAGEREGEGQKLALESAKEGKGGVWKEHDLDCVHEPLGKYMRSWAPLVAVDT